MWCAQTPHACKYRHFRPNKLLCFGILWNHKKRTTSLSFFIVCFAGSSHYLQQDAETTRKFCHRAVFNDVCCGAPQQRKASVDCCQRVTLAAHRPWAILKRFSVHRKRRGELKRGQLVIGMGMKLVGIRWWCGSTKLWVWWDGDGAGVHYCVTVSCRPPQICDPTLLRAVLSPPAPSPVAKSVPRRWCFGSPALFVLCRQNFNIRKSIIHSFIHSLILFVQSAIK